jgi:hypothetical protein
MRGLWRRILFGSLFFVTTLLTQLGLRHWPEILRSLQRSQGNHITEWRPPTLSPDYPAIRRCPGSIYDHNNDGGVFHLVRA